MRGPLRDGKRKREIGGGRGGVGIRKCIENK